ncbi:hypothetical protein A5893_08155 [Pedobacter psychrophilus]|uniref:Photosynthesis system II assembly factor Ycf48/Hcf136-like domain-containing protein n=2 Tax=Pedobacter psychrophilus TaxID=1826909 RepID=A0A179DF07_9SPHI|nr:hypothetical protein A5893_08155 [Pedobacter psychrophilus]
MKRLLVFVPAILLLMFVLNSFVPKEKEAVKKIKSERVNIVLKSTDGGQTWQDFKQVLPEIKHYSAVKGDGVIISTSQDGIKRSTDNGEHWQWIIKEGEVGIAVERIEGGFAALSYSTATKSRRIHISLDNGETWKAIDEGLRPSSLISSIKQVGKYLICGHPDGIFHSADQGKTWNRVLRGVNNNEFLFDIYKWNSPFQEPKYVFRIYESENILYATAVPAGC